MGEDRSKPKRVESEKPKGGLASKLELGLCINDDGGDLYQDTVKRLISQEARRNKNIHK
jgi:hypothetical protein